MSKKRKVLTLIMLAVCSLCFLFGASCGIEEKQEEHEHIFTNYVSNNDATCEADGTKTAKCELCNELNTVVDEGTKKSHEFTNYVSNNDATCSQDGTKTAKCNNCSATDTKADIGSKGKHVFTNYVSNQDATCSQDGTKTAKCEYCSAKDTITDTGSKIPHNVASYISDNNATCEADGTKTGYCSTCQNNITVTDVGSKKAHTFVTYTSDNNATCENDGTKTAKCEYCSAKDTKADVGSKKQHSFVSYSSNGDATCEADGTKTAKCEHCSATDTVADTGSKKAHTFNTYTSDGNATCDDDGTKTAKCEYCSATNTISDVGSKGHKYGTPTYTWSSDYSKCTAKAVCLRDNTHKVEEEVDSSKNVVQELTDEKDELTNYSATFTNSMFSKQEKKNIVTKSAGGLATLAEMANVTYSKTASAGGAMTVNPEGNITYTITVTNNNTSEIYVKVTDTIPTGVTYVSGCDNVSGSTLTWKKVKINASEVKKISYVVKVNYKLADISSDRVKGKAIEGKSAKVMDKDITYTDKIYVQETFNANDEKRIEIGVQALADETSNKITGLEKVKWIYIVGFTASLTISKDVEEMLDQIYELAGQNQGSSGGGEEAISQANNMLTYVIPTLFGGTQVPASKDSLFKGSRATTISKNDFLSGDIFLTEKNGELKLYVFYHEKFVEFSDGIQRVNLLTDNFNTILTNLSSYDRYVGIRFSAGLKTKFTPEDDTSFNDNDASLTDAQKAIVTAAYQYLYRGTNIQYNDNATSYPFGANGLLREQVEAVAPENATTDDKAYSNCAFFTYDIYYQVLGYKFMAPITSGGSSTRLNTTYNLANAASLSSNKNITALYLTKSQMSTKTVAQIKEQVYSTLKPGDILCIRRQAGNGHALLYVGNGYIIHCSGSSFSIKNGTDTYDAGIRLERIEDMFNEATKSESYTQYIPVMNSFSILRPLNAFTSTVPQNSQDRTTELKNIYSEKTCSVPVGITVNKGQEITYTYSVRNYDNSSRTITISDKVPTNTSYVSSTENGSYVSPNITWNFTLEPDELKQVSYTIIVNNVTDILTDASSAKKISASNGKVNGVAHKCHGLLVSNTLTSSEQQTLLTALDTVKGNITSSTDGVTVANAIYNEAFGITNAMCANSVYDYLPLADVFSVDENAIGLAGSGKAGDAFSTTTSATYSLSKPIDMTNVPYISVYHNMIACKVYGLDSSDNIVDIKSLTTSDNYNTYTKSTNVVKAYIEYKTSSVNEFRAFKFTNSSERTTSSTSLFVRYGTESYKNSMYTFMLERYGKKALMVAPTLYGGYSLISSYYNSTSDVMPQFSGTRMRDFSCNDLVVGDILYEYTYVKGYIPNGTGVKWSNAITQKTPTFYMYIGDNKLVSLMGDDIYTEYNAEEKVISCFYNSQLYAVLRPSMQNNI